MSLNQIIDPVKPLDVRFGNVTADNIAGTETTYLKDIVGASITTGDNVQNCTLTADRVLIENLGDLIDGVQTFKQKRYFALEGQVTTTAAIVPGKEGTFELNINDPSITTEYFNNYKTLVSAIGEVNDGLTNFSGSFYIDANTIINGSITLKFVSAYGVIKPTTVYKINFDLTFSY
jgi:hypothetical protein